MTNDGLVRRLLLVALVLSIVQAAWHLVQLPALSAAWFDAAGEPRVFVPTQWLAWGHAGLACAVAAAAWLVPEFGGPRQTAGPSQRPGVAGLAESATAYAERRARERHVWRVTWLGLVTLLVLGAIAQLVYDANRTPIPRLDVEAVLWIGAGYGAFLLLWALRGSREFGTTGAGPR
ncbi:MAG: hypothetical protein ACK53C_14845 [Pseudomonadota bacterium]